MGTLVPPNLKEKTKNELKPDLEEKKVVRVQENTKEDHSYKRLANKKLDRLFFGSPTTKGVHNQKLRSS